MISELGITVVSFLGSLIIFIPPDLLESIATNRSLGWPGIAVIAGFAVPSVGLIIALSRGGYVVIQHTALRALLWREKNVPRHMARFLDYTSERVLTRKVGGGYIFIHRMLLEHFAESDDANDSHQMLDDTYEPIHHRLVDAELDDDDLQRPDASPKMDKASYQ